MWQVFLVLATRQSDVRVIVVGSLRVSSLRELLLGTSKSQTGIAASLLTPETVVTYAVLSQEPTTLLACVLYLFSISSEVTSGFPLCHISFEFLKTRSVW